MVAGKKLSVQFEVFWSSPKIWRQAAAFNSLWGLGLYVVVSTICRFDNNGAM